MNDLLRLAGGADLVAPGYSVPAFVDWNADTLPDLIVGEGGGTSASGLCATTRATLVR